MLPKVTCARHFCLQVGALGGPQAVVGSSAAAVAASVGSVGGGSHTAGGAAGAGGLLGGAGVGGAVGASVNSAGGAATVVVKTKAQDGKASKETSTENGGWTQLRCEGL